MMNRKIKQLALAVGVALGGAGLLPSAQAVNVSPDNLGQALIYQYYTVRGGWNTLLHVTNTTGQWVAVRTRFHEAYNSRDVMDFIVILSPEDWWGATVYNVNNGGTDGNNASIGIFPDENSCVIGLQPRGEQFPVPVSYRTPNNDGGPQTVDRLRSGYAEMIMMGATTGRTIPYTCTELQALFTGRFPANTPTLNPAGALAALQGVFSEYPSNALKGQFSLVNLTKGMNAATLPTALNNFRTAQLVTLHLPPGGAVPYPNSWHEPSLNSATTPGEYIGADGALVPGAAAGAAAVTSALEASTLLNEWSRNAAGASDGTTTFVTATDWTITFPTKNFYVDTDTNQYAGHATGRTPPPPAFVANQPFAQEFDGTSCDEIGLTVFNREEDFVIPRPVPSPTANVFQLCKETNVLTFNQGTILQEADVVFVNFENIEPPFLYGWMKLDFLTNLPPVGFAITTRDLASTFLSEGAAYNHSIVRPAPVTP